MVARHLAPIYCARLLRANAASNILMSHQTAIEALQCSGPTLRMSDFEKRAIFQLPAGEVLVQCIDFLLEILFHIPLGSLGVLFRAKICLVGWHVKYLALGTQNGLSFGRNELEVLRKRSEIFIFSLFLPRTLQNMFYFLQSLVFFFVAWRHFFCQLLFLLLFHFRFHKFFILFDNVLRLRHVFAICMR